MVRAILEGRKTQTRRICKDLVVEGATATGCKYGIPGDRLWVKETFQPLWVSEEPGDYKTGHGYNINYVATGGIKEWVEGGEGELTQKCTPSIFMPRWASRITLEVVGVRVERLQDISEADAKSEGIRLNSMTHWETEARDAYKTLWESINGAGSWDANPWVWVIEFKKL